MLQDWSEKFLEALAKSPSVTDAAKACGIERSTAYRWRKDDPEFAARWDDAIEQSTDALIAEIYRRAVAGCDEPVYYKGEEVGAVRKYSDTLAMFLAKAHRPAVYREVVKQEHSGPDGGPVRHVVDLKPLLGEELHELRRIARRLADGRSQGGAPGG